MANMRDFIRIIEGAETNPVSTPQFKVWFKDSKIVDANGNPRIVYHGTGKDFTIFKNDKSESGHRASKIGFWFTDDHNIAQSFSDFARGSANIKPVYLSIQNPKIYVSNGKIDSIHVFMQDFNRFVKFARPNYLMPSVVDKESGEVLLSEPIRMMDDKVDVDGFRQYLISAGYDGIIIKDTVADTVAGSDNNVDQIVAFYSRQVKSAISNTGRYNPEDENITEDHQPMENIPSIISNIVKKMGFDDPAEINDGYAGIFADKLERALNGPNKTTFIMLSDDLDRTLPDHEWVVHNGLNYDSETPEGVLDPLDLKIFKDAI